MPCDKGIPGSTPAPAVVLGVTGSIAAYKAADLTSKLAQAGLNVQVVMTTNAAKLVQPQTFLTLSQNPVITDLWTVPDWRPEHIALAEKATLLVVAPATANFIGKYANGIADDALTTVALSHEGPVMIAPAMNPRMWRHPAVQANCRILRERGVIFLGPVAGHVACSGDGEPGRMVAPEIIANAVRARLAGMAAGVPPGPGRGPVLVTAGPTREALDPVRYLTNRSSGKMGYALAEVAAAMGYQVVLVSGPTNLPPPVLAERTVQVNSAAEMAAATTAEFPCCKLLIMTAAVADYRPATIAQQKIKKGQGSLVLELARTTDILNSLAKTRKAEQTIVGFAAETENLEASAKQKMQDKKLDWIVANDVSRHDIGLGSDNNAVTLFGPNGKISFIERCPKLILAARLLAAFLG